MLKIFYHPEESEPENQNVVAEASNWLDVGEYQLFQLAYFAWFGEEAEPKFLESCFFDYLLKEEIPSWARHYSRDIMTRNDAGELNPIDAEYHRYDTTGSPDVSRGWKFFIIPATVVAVALYLIFIVITDPAFNPPQATCYFPPCLNTEQYAADPDERPYFEFER